MACSHEDFHEIRTTYERRRGLIVYFWACERCGTRLGEAGREAYRPAYDPTGNDRFRMTSDLAVVSSSSQHEGPA